MASPTEKTRAPAAESIGSELGVLGYGYDGRLSPEGTDDALKVLDGVSGTTLLTPERERALLWKIDLHLIPVFSLLYGLQFLDKTTISYAAVMGIIQDTNLKGDDFNWLGSVFYFGYLFWEYPANYLMQKLPLSKFTSFNIIVWGGILMLHAAGQNFAGLTALRLLLGVFEASITPAFLLFVSQWWRTKEQAFRTSMWFCWNGVAQIVGAVCAYAMLEGIQKHNYTALGGWQLLFFATGGLTILAGILFYFVVPDSPATAWFLTAEEKVMAIERLRENNQGVGNKRFKRYQFIEAFTDPQTWFIATFVVISSIPNGFLTTFKNILLKGLGLSAKKSLLYGAPNGAVQIISTLLCGYLADKFRNRMILATLAMLVSLIGLSLAVSLPRSNLTGNLAAFYLTSTSAASFVLLVSCISSNVAGYTKKTTVNAIVFIAYCVGNLIGPHTIDLKDGPMFIEAKTISLIAWAISAALLVCLRFYYTRRNTRKENKINRMGDSYQRMENLEFLDLTDRENPEFRYTY